ncbi:hypothetical protein KAI92_02105 [Candidatus Parcubacteria bacterium]|nr:hypothetical protein [Candidatus Parcubacteria bacterium]
MRKVCLVTLIIGMILFSCVVCANEIKLDLKHIPQINCEDGIGEKKTNDNGETYCKWKGTLICGPVSLLTEVAYLQDFNPTSQDIKNLIDWMVENKIGGYSTGRNREYYGHLTSCDQIIRCAKSYYGMSDVVYKSKSSADLKATIALIEAMLNVKKPVVIATKINMISGNSGHFMVLDGLKDANNNGVYSDNDDEVHVTDPGRSIGSGWGQKWYKVSTFWSSLSSVMYFNSIGVSPVVKNKIYNFTFPSGLSEGMTSNWCMEENLLTNLDEWRVGVNSTEDPGVNSPSYPSGLIAKNIVIEFSAKVLNGGNPALEGKVYVKDEANSWNNSVSLDLINSEVGYNGGEFAVNEYNVYRAVLADLYRPDTQMRQFSIQLTDGLSISETWTFDWIKVKVVAWDFKDNSIAWEFRQHGKTADFFPAMPNSEFWRINPTGKRPQIMSPDDLMIADFYTKIGIRYSIKNTTEEIFRVYFDIGNGFSNDCMVEMGIDNKVAHDGNSKTVILNIPPEAIGKVKRVMFDLFDNDNYQNKQIAINNISFLVEGNNTVAYEVPACSIFLSSGGAGGSDGDYDFVSSTICEATENGTPIGKNYSFYPSTDNYVGFFYTLANIYDSLSVDVKWFRPDGTLYGECNSITDFPTNVYWQYYKRSNYFNILGLTEYGVWKVELYINGSKIATQFFNLKVDGSNGGSQADQQNQLGVPMIMYIQVE